MKTAYLALSKLKNTDSFSEKMIKVWNNTGNIVFDTPLKKMFGKVIFKDELTGDADYDALIIHNAIWILPSTTLEDVKAILEKAGTRPVVPISVGVQTETGAKEFNFHPDCIKVLKSLSERAVLGVRGEKTAMFLNAAGIKNIRVIGCPSLYYPLDYNFSIKPKQLNSEPLTDINYGTFYTKICREDEDFLLYCARRRLPFVEQVPRRLISDFVSSEESEKELTEYLSEYENLFFDFEEWLKFAASFDFSMGFRFHANIMSVLAGIPALFFPLDSRTLEMCEFFRLPTFDRTKFDITKPLSYYYDQADYTEFNKHYRQNLFNFLDFCKTNHIAETLEKGIEAKNRIKIPRTYDDGNREIIFSKSRS